MQSLNAKEMLRTAAALHMNNQFQQAHNLYVELVQRDPSNAHALHLLGVLLLQNGFHQEGKDAIERAIALRGSYPEAVANLASFGCSVPAKWQMDIEHSDKTKTTEWCQYESVSTDRWRHLRMVDFATCFASVEEEWLTIGDAHGYDSIMLRQMGISNVVASSLDVTMLKKGHEAGVVGDYLVINAESISQPDDSFDYVLCKEALHHMPRPILAIYEMLRVARKGVIFIEPQDPLIDWPANRNHSFWRHIEGDKILYGRNGDDTVMTSHLIDWYEDGPFNYVYTLSKREVHKICLGMGLPSYAIKCFSDFYNAEWADQPAEPECEGFKKTLEQIQLWDSFSNTTGKPFNYLTGILFKQSPQPTLMQNLQKQGYEFNFTPTRFLPLKWPDIEA